MNPGDFEKLREGRPGCPSDLALDRLLAGELKADAKAAAEGHVAGCADCTARVAVRQKGFDAHPEVDPRRLLAAIRRAADERPAPATSRIFRAFRLLLAPLAVAGVAALVLTRGGGEGSGGTREKGAGPALHVYRLVGGASQEAFSGDRFRPGEPLRFTVELAEARAVAMVGVDGGGRLYRVWPSEDAASTLAAGKTELPGAVALDDSPGTETFHLVACPPAVAPACTVRGEGLACPAGCADTAFRLEKAR